MHSWNMDFTLVFILINCFTRDQLDGNLKFDGYNLFFSLGKETYIKKKKMIQDKRHQHKEGWGIKVLYHALSPKK